MEILVIYHYDISEDPDWYPFQICRNPCLYNLRKNQTIDESHTLPIFKNTGEDRNKCENINHKMLKRKTNTRKVPGPKKRKDLLNLQVMKGKNRNLEGHRPHIKNIMKYLVTFAEEKDENVEEILYYLLHNNLAKECKFTNAKQFLQIYRGVILGQLTPEEGFANRIFANRSKEEQHEFRRFPSNEEEEEVSNTFKPRSVSFKLYLQTRYKSLRSTHRLQSSDTTKKACYKQRNTIRIDR